MKYLRFTTLGCKDIGIRKFEFLAKTQFFFFFFSATHPWPFSKSKFHHNSNRVNLVAPASPIECVLYLPNVPAIQYKLGPERLTRLGNSNALRLPVAHNKNNRSYKVTKYAWRIHLTFSFSLGCTRISKSFCLRKALKTF